MEYNFAEIEQRAKNKWTAEEVYKVTNPTDSGAKPKCYILDMFPYPSGAGLHVGHPLGYIASDIYARYKRLTGYNVLHPMGFDAFGLPAEQYALETGQHPVDTTRKNIARYREQLDNIGFCYDWSREVRTSDPKYYKWTQWIFLQLFHSWFDRSASKVRPINELVAIFETEGNTNHVCPGNENIVFDATTWNSYTEKEKRDCLMQYRMAYQGYAQVWWCEALGTVLANDEVVNGVSERGNHPVERKNMRQWFLRITEYAERLLTSLENLEWSDAMKEMQRNWIGKSVGAEVTFESLTPALSRGEGDVETSKLKSLTPALSEGEGGIEPSKLKSLSEGEVEPSGLGNPGWQTAEKTLYNSIAPFQNELKNNLTEAEDAVWQRLRNHNIGAKFRRQHVIGRFIADFVCLPNKLVVEIDGGIHEQQKEEDAIRTAYLNEKGYRVIRFSNDEVFQNIDAVINKIKQEIETGAPAHPNNNTNTNNNDNNTSLSLGEGWGEAPLHTNNTSLSLGEGRGEAAPHPITVFTTRPDTIFGVDFMVLAPEHELVDAITTAEQKTAVDEYKTYVKSRSERERMSEVKQITGCFTGAYAAHPFTGQPVPIWIAEYVLAGYGTGAIMAVPSGDDRDFAFAKHFGIPITNIFGEKFTGDKAYSDKTGTIENSGFVSGKTIPEAAALIIDALAANGKGKKKINYKLRDAGFSRQRYWGEPFPIVYVNDIPYAVDEAPVKDTNLNSLPVELPYVEGYKPGPEGQGPLANIDEWMNTPAGQRETNTMPGYAGSSWYFLRYMDPHNDATFADRKATDYWNQVDLYIGGTEHAVGHLLYSRMWTKALYDLGHIGFDEPFKRLLNQGMIQGSSRFAYRVLNHGNFDGDFDTNSLKQKFISADIVERSQKGDTEAKEKIQNFIEANKHSDEISENISKIHVHVSLVDGYELDINAYKADEAKKNRKTENYVFLLNDDGKFICTSEVEKMSKSKYNVVNPDDIVAQYGADTFRMYEMFLGPIDVSKPWDTKGIEGVHRFLKKMWRLYFNDAGWAVTNDTPTDEEYRALHKTIKKIGDDIERFSFNTSVSQFMICVNELSALGCRKRAILEPLAVAICPFAPHIAEELWKHFGNSGSVIDASFPKYEERYVSENSKKYPVAVNGKTRAEMEFALDAAPADIEKAVLADEAIQKWMEGKPLKKFIYVRGKMINVVA